MNSSFERKFAEITSILISMFSGDMREATHGGGNGLTKCQELQSIREIGPGDANCMSSVPDYQ
jgi:hypothetical protein